MADIALSHHIGANHWIIDKLVEIGSEHRAITFLAASLPSFSPEQLKSLPQRLDSLPPPTTGAQIMQGEYDQMVKRSKEEGLAVQIIVSGMQGFFKDMGDSMELPPEEFAKAVDSQVNQLKLNPMAGGLGSSLKAIQVQMAMLRN